MSERREAARLMSVERRNKIGELPFPRRPLKSLLWSDREGRLPKMLTNVIGSQNGDQ